MALVSPVNTCFYAPETINYLSKCFPKPTGQYIGALDKFIRQLIIDGNWSQLDCLWVFATEQQQHARINLINPLNFTITEVSSPTWTSKKGYNGNGTSYLSTNYNPHSQSTNYTQNSASIGVYIIGTFSSSATVTDIGSNDGVNGVGIQIRQSNIDFLYLNQPDAGQATEANPSKETPGFYAGVRTSSSSVNIYFNGASSSTSGTSASSGGIPNLALFICCRNNNGSPSLNTTKQYSMAFAGSGNINIAKLYNSFQTFATTIGFNV